MTCAKCGEKNVYITDGTTGYCWNCVWEYKPELRIPPP